MEIDRNKINWDSSWRNWRFILKILFIFLGKITRIVFDPSGIIHLDFRQGRIYFRWKTVGINNKRNWDSSWRRFASRSLRKLNVIAENTGDVTRWPCLIPASGSFVSLE